MKDRIAIIDGIRTPFCKSNGVFKDWRADDLGAFVVKELLNRVDIAKEDVDELIFGNVLQPPHASNIARVIAVKGGMPINAPAFTVNRNCASGLESITSAVNKITYGAADVIISGGTESMSNFPILFKKEFKELLMKFQKARSFTAKLKLLFSIRLSYLMPDIPGMDDPLCSLSMGQTAEILARKFHVTRVEQDEYAFLSQKRSLIAQENNTFNEEIVPIPTNDFLMQTIDDGIRGDCTMVGLAKLKPVFNRISGSLTAGNSSQITDGAAAVLLMRESKAKELKLSPLGYIRDYAYAALEPSVMGLGPVFATAKLLDKTKIKLKNIDLIEINEAFAAQVIACEKAFNSKDFAKKELNKDSSIGEIDRDILNVNGGAVALGHPIGTTGTRLVLTLLKELRRRDKNLGLATLCVGGGQGGSLIIEVE